jgi:hypothetical protein
MAILAFGTMRFAGVPHGRRGSLENERDWTGNALDLRGVLDPHGISEVVIEFEEGDTDVFTSRLNKDFKAYELHQMAGYLDGIIGSIKKGQRN